MATFTRFVPNPAGIAAIPYMPEMTAAMLVGANQGVETAQAIAPVDTGAYRASIRSEANVGLPGANFSADVIYAAFIEFGTSRTPTFATLRRAMDSINL